MDLIGIISNYFGIGKHQNFTYNLSNETIQDLMQISEYHKIGNHQVIITNGLFPPYDWFIFNPYFQMIMCILMVWTLQDMFDELLWPYIRTERNKVYRWLWCLIKRSMRYLKKN